MNIEYLTKILKEKNISLIKLSSLLNISVDNLKKKITNDRNLKIKDTIKLQEILSLNNDQLNKLIFNK